MGMNFFYPAPRPLCDRHTPRTVLIPADRTVRLAVRIPAILSSRWAWEDVRCGDGDDRSEEGEAKERGDELASLGETQRSIHRRVIMLVAGLDHAN